MKTLKEKVVSEFLTQVQIDSLSLKEEKMYNYLQQRLKDLPVEMDFSEYAVDDIGQCSGNLIVKIPSNSKTKTKALFFDAHVDTVEPGLGIRPIVDGDVIRSDGKTILGADDKGGSAAMVIAIEEILTANIEHGDLYFIFTSAEEIGLFGVHHLDFENIKADYGFILDSHGTIGGVVMSAPFHVVYDIIVHGRASHAGIEPEKGISAIKIAASLICDLPQGEINDDTVANIGMIEGGKATNIVPDECRIRGEYRSIKQEDTKKLRTMIETIVDKHRKTAVSIDININEAYPGFTYQNDSPIIQLTDKAMKEMNIEPRHETTKGGSNTNVYNQHDIVSLTLANGMMNVHSTDEYIRTQDLEDMTRLIIQLVKTAD